MKSAIKKGCLGFILILLLLFLNGCNTKTYTVQDVHFKRNMTIDLNSKNTPLNLISDVDGIKVDSSNIKGNKFSFKNLVIRYDTFSNKKEGSFNITFNTNDPNAKSFTKNIKVADVSKPVIHLKKKKIKFYVDEYQTIDFYKYFTYEDNSNIDDLTVMIDSSKITQNAGSYDVTIQVYDKAKNTAYAKIKVILKDRPVPKQEEQSNNKAEVIMYLVVLKRIHRIIKTRISNQTINLIRNMSLSHKQIVLHHLKFQIHHNSINILLVILLIHIMKHYLMLKV